MIPDPEQAKRQQASQRGAHLSWLLRYLVYRLTFGRVVLGASQPGFSVEERPSDRTEASHARFHWAGDGDDDPAPPGWLRWVGRLTLATAAICVIAAIGVGAKLQADGGMAALAPGSNGYAPGEIPGPVELFTLAQENLQTTDPDKARAINAALPFSAEPTPKAAPFKYPTADTGSYNRAVDCLTAAVYYEAGAEVAGGQLAVAQVILNRMRHPAYPKTVCGVVFEGHQRSTGCQFTFTCDGALGRPPNARAWARARGTAIAALNGLVSSEVGTATHYHTDWVAPVWAPKLTKVRKIGTHIFYRWPGRAGLTGAFRGVLSGAEPVLAKMTPFSGPEPVAMSEDAPLPDAGPPAVVDDPKASTGAEPAGGETSAAAPTKAPPAPAAPDPTVSVTGEVKFPGAFPMMRDMTVDIAIKSAGGFGYRANKKKVFLKRAGEAEERNVSEDLNVTLAPGDTVRVAERLF